MSTSTSRPASSQSGTSPILDRLVEELTNRIQAGEAIDLEAYAHQYPEYADSIGQLLPALEVLADLGRSAARGPVRGLPAGLESSDGTGVLGDFRILREVGRGGMGVVYEAEQISLGRRVALKVLPFAAALDPRQLQRFKVEAQAAALLHHTHIVPVYSVGVERGVHYYAMQFIEGRTLAAVIRELRRFHGLMPTDHERVGSDRSAMDLAAALTSGRLPAAGSRPAEVPSPPSPATPAPTPSDGPSPPTATFSSGTSITGRAFFQAAARLGIQAAEGLEYAHSLGVVHRDIKPANLLVDGRGGLWVADFGLAQVQAEGGLTLTLTGDVLGTLRYMSPEQALGRRALVDHRSDIYSLGATLYELLTLHPAIEGTDRQEILRRIAFDDPAELRRHNPAVPRELETIVLKAMAREPEGRYATAQELADDLARYLDHRPIRARRPSPLERAGKWARRHRAAVATAVAVLLVAVVGLTTALVVIARERAEAIRQRNEAVSQGRIAAANFRRARDAVDQMLTEVGESTLAQVPQMGATRKALLEKALAFYRQFLDERGGDPAVRLEAGRAERRVGDIDRMLGRTAQAEASDRESINLLERLADDARDASEAALELAKSHTNLAQVYQEAGRAADAESYYRRARDRLIAMAAKRPGWEPLRTALLRASLDWGGLLARQRDRLPEAERELHTALEIANGLIEEYPSAPDYPNGAAGALSNLAYIALQRGDQEVGRDLLRRAIPLARRALDADPGHHRYREFYLNVNNNLAIVLVKLGETREAEQVMGRVVSENERRSQDFPGVPRYRRSLAHSLMNYGNMRGEDGDRRGKEDAYRRARGLLEELVADFPTIAGHVQDLAGCLAIQSDLAVSRGDSPEGIKLAEEAIAAEPRYWKCWAALGQARYRAGDWKAASEAYERAREHSPDGVVPSDGGFIMAMVLWRRGEKQPARACYERAIKWMEKYDPRNQDLRRYRAEAAALLGLDDATMPNGTEAFAR